MHQLVKKRRTLHHLPVRLQKRGPKAVGELVTRLEALETAEWAAARLFDVELFTPVIVDPCVGLGRLTEAARMRGHQVLALDIFDWGFPKTVVCDFLGPRAAQLIRNWVGAEQEFSVVMNPPFRQGLAFAAEAWALGPRKLAMFNKMSFFGTQSRRPWLANHPPSRIWICGERATCWRFDFPPEKRDSSTPEQHAWFVWERGHGGPPITRNIWETD
jgi:hypothetical protein